MITLALIKSEVFSITQNNFSIGFIVLNENHTDGLTIVDHFTPLYSTLLNLISFAQFSLGFIRSESCD